MSDMPAPTDAMVASHRAEMLQEGRGKNEGDLGQDELQQQVGDLQDYVANAGGM